jgi:hypothetical protein
VLEAAAGCCIAKTWRWSIRTRSGETFRLQRTPNRWGWQHTGSGPIEDQRLPHEQQEMVERGIDAVAARGLSVVEADPGWLRARFGGRVGQARIASGDGADLPIRAFRVTEPLPNFDAPSSNSVATRSDRLDGQLVDGVSEGRRLPRVDEVMSLFRGIDHVERDPYILIRGGDTMLLVEYYYFTGPR